ncbi:RNA-binding protein [Methanothermobacter sp.]|uniref:RNA-binding protein n=1 Tax=Methanothermobacter sp. TaxID=1884223 RepID=UPI002621C964|nr:RNA-binding protein [Methanothermobacter sp.]MDI9614065.1 RNA-binding protein [Methanothermobacter sp.]
MNVKIKKRYHIKKKKMKEILDQIGEFSLLIPRKATVEIIETDENDIILINGESLLMFMGGRVVPTLRGAIHMKDIEKGYVVVDMGAVRFLANGADVMSPGIVDADPEIERDDIVIVVDEKHKKPLAVGISLISGPEMIENDSGKAIKTIHHIGDAIWDLEV